MRHPSVGFGLGTAPFPEEGKHPFWYRLVKDMIVERMKKLFAVRSALEKIHDLLFDATWHKAGIGDATADNRRRKRFALAFHQLHRDIIGSNRLGIVTFRVFPLMRVTIGNKRRSGAPCNAVMQNWLEPTAHTPTPIGLLL